MKSGWDVKKLGDLCEFVRGPFGGSLKKNCFVNDGIAVYEQQHAIYDQFEDVRYFITEQKFKEMKRFELFPNDLIMSCSGTMGKAAIVPENIKRGIINQALLKLTPKPTLNVHFLKYWMESEDFKNKLAKNTKGAAIKNVASVQTLKSILLPCPTLERQRQIVAILDECFAAIDQAQANIEKNLKNTQELLQVELDQLFSKKGSNWKEMQLQEICTLINGRAYSQNELLNKGKYRVLRVGNFFTNKSWYYSDLELAEDKYCEEGDLLYAWSASFGPRIWTEEKVIYHYHIWKVIPIHGVVDKNYLYLLLDWDKERIKAAHGAGTTMIHVSKGSMEKRVLPVPSLKEQNLIVANINLKKKLNRDMESTYRRKLEVLEELRKSLLDKAFKGELISEPSELLA